jgi:tRNA threonylcarbamoyladenosine biosynthesis protein TsaE
VKLLSNNHDDTEDIGFKLGKTLKPGDVVGLYGELGSGKTTMVKGIARAFGIDSRDITSSSFTIISEYLSDPLFCHIDLYRIDNRNSLDNTGLWDYISSNAVSVIEWAEKLEGIIPEDYIKVRIKAGGNNLREIIIEGINEKDWNNL